MRGHLVALIALCAAVPGISTAQKWEYHPLPKHTYHSYGDGPLSCGSWVSDRHIESHFSEEQWVLGYISAVGYYDVFELKYTPEAHKGFDLYIDTYCQQHPLDTIEDATDHLVEDLRVDRAVK